jgi:hypothetical protein
MARRRSILIFVLAERSSTESQHLQRASASSAPTAMERSAAKGKPKEACVVMGNLQRRADGTRARVQYLHRVDSPVSHVAFPTPTSSR